MIVPLNERPINFMWLLVPPADPVEGISRDNFKGSLPLERLLPQSVYYPASHLDDDPIRHLHRHFSSFIYADYWADGRDYGYTDDSPAKEVLEALETSFAGCRVAAVRRLSETELAVSDWRLDPAGFNEGGNRLEIRRKAKAPHSLRT